MAWTNDDEKTLRKLLSKRRRDKTWSKGHDIKFTEDLLVGEDGEASVLKAFEKAEVKSDFGAGKTGNVFIEHESFGKPSGIETTESDWWAFNLAGEGYDSEVIIVINTNRLQDILNQKKWTTRGGDFNKSVGKLIRVSQLVKPMFYEQDR